jgi:hypothetical protein
LFVGHRFGFREEGGERRGIVTVFVPVYGEGAADK